MKEHGPLTRPTFLPPRGWQLRESCCHKRRSTFSYCSDPCFYRILATLNSVLIRKVITEYFQEMFSRPRRFRRRFYATDTVGAKATPRQVWPVFGCNHSIDSLFTGHIVSAPLGLQDSLITLWFVTHILMTTGIALLLCPNFLAFWAPFSLQSTCIRSRTRNAADLTQADITNAPGKAWSGGTRLG